mgnify:FL=1
MIELINGNCKDFDPRDITDKPICIVTDPPFNVGYKYKSYKDNLNEDEYYTLLCSALLNGETPFVVVHYPEALHKLTFRIGVFPERICSWVYNSNTQRQHRDVAFYNVTPDFKKVIQPYKNQNDKRIKARIERGILGAKLYDWWNVNQVKNVSKIKRNHPCQMPLEVMTNIIGILPDEYVIYDPSMGSGTTGMACTKLGRDFICCEIDNDYFRICEEVLTC